MCYDLIFPVYNNPDVTAGIVDMRLELIRRYLYNCSHDGRGMEKYSVAFAAKA